MASADVLTIGGIGLMVQDRAEETRGSPGQFWQYPYEISQLVTESLNEAALISGEPQTACTIPIIPNQTVQPMPPWITALLRLEFNGTPIQKTSLWNLDRFLPYWEQQTPNTSIGPDPSGNGPFWFPLGISSFGIYPQVSSAQYVILAGVAIPAAATPSLGSLSPPSYSAYNPQNLVIDPGFIGGTAQWNTGSIVIASLPNGSTGSSLQFTASGGSGSLFSQPFSLVSGCNYSYSGWIITGGVGTWHLYYANASSGLIYTIGSPTSWIFISESVQAPGPASLTQGQWGIVNSGSSDTATIWHPSAVSDYVPFQQEYGESFADMAASSARLKDGSSDLQQGLMSLQDFMSKMTALSRFGLRKSGLRFTTTLGSVSRATDVDKRF